MSKLNGNKEINEFLFPLKSGLTQRLFLASDPPLCEPGHGPSSV